MKEIKLELIEECPKEVQQNIKDTFEFPEYYGMNLDAFYECLCEISCPTLIEVILDEMNLYHKKVWKVLQDAHKTNENLRIEKIQE